MDQLSAVAGKQYQGDGLSVAAAPDGARLRCVFQRLVGQVTSEGLWLTSTAEAETGQRFRVLAVAVGRASPEPSVFKSRPSTLPAAGTVEVADQITRFIRPGLIEEYSVSTDGVRQDFLVEARPAGTGELCVELELNGVSAAATVYGAELTLDGSERVLAYHRLRATDATGRKLPARMHVASGILPDVKGAHPAARNWGRASITLGETRPKSAGLEATALRAAGMPVATRLALLVDDTDAMYPVRIDPTFSDADWVG